MKNYVKAYVYLPEHKYVRAKDMRKVNFGFPVGDGKGRHYGLIKEDELEKCGDCELLSLINVEFEQYRDLAQGIPSVRFSTIIPLENETEFLQLIGSAKEQLPKDFATALEVNVELDGWVDYMVLMDAIHTITYDGKTYSL